MTPHIIQPTRRRTIKDSEQNSCILVGIFTCMLFFTTCKWVFNLLTVFLSITYLLQLHLLVSLVIKPYNFISFFYLICFPLKI
uniref:Uncharacterized protein n=1 Tax=Populus trichocarpa TaxID=3694 RepID=A0A2K2AG27_POPTR